MQLFTFFLQFVGGKDGFIIIFIFIYNFFLIWSSVDFFMLSL